MCILKSLLRRGQLLRNSLLPPCECLVRLLEDGDLSSAVLDKFLGFANLRISGSHVAWLDEVDDFFLLPLERSFELGQLLLDLGELRNVLLITIRLLRLPVRRCSANPCWCFELALAYATLGRNPIPAAASDDDTERARACAAPWLKALDSLLGHATSPILVSGHA